MTKLKIFPTADFFRNYPQYKGKKFFLLDWKTHQYCDSEVMLKVLIEGQKKPRWFCITYFTLFRRKKVNKK